MVFVSLPSRKRAHRRWAAALLALVALAVFLWMRFGLDARGPGDDPAGR